METTEATEESLHRLLYPLASVYACLHPFIPASWVLAGTSSSSVCPPFLPKPMPPTAFAISIDGSTMLPTAWVENPDIVFNPFSQSLHPGKSASPTCRMHPASGYFSPPSQLALLSHPPSASIWITAQSSMAHPQSIPQSQPGS